MSVLGGLTTCWMARIGVLTLASNSLNRAGRHCWKAASFPPRRRPPPPPPPPPPPASVVGGVPPAWVVGVVLSGKAPLVCRQARMAWRSASLSGAGRTVVLIVSPPVWI